MEDPDNPESEQYRENLADEIKNAPKDEGKEILDKAKETPEYWQARGEKISERQNEQEIDDGLGVFVERKTIYHGSGTSEIKRFDLAEEDTVGSGIYFTSQAKDAIGYARIRAGRNGDPIIYEASIENIKLLDLRKKENVQKVLTDLRPKLEQKLSDPDLKWWHKGALRRAIETIDSRKVGAGNVREVAFSFGQTFSSHVKSLGYDGLITFEGGEGGAGASVGDHDTYLIFDPEKVKISREHKIV